MFRVRLLHIQIVGMVLAPYLIKSRQRDPEFKLCFSCPHYENVLTRPPSVFTFVHLLGTQ